LDAERAGAGAQRLLHERQGLGDLRAVPAAAVLLLEHDEVAVLVEPRVAPRVVQEHQGEQCRGLGGRRGLHERADQAGEPDGLDAEIAAHEGLAPGGRVALGEDQVDHRQHRVEPGRHVAGLGHGVGDARVADLALGAHEPLRHGGDGHQERARDLVRLEPAQRAQRQSDLRLRRQRGMAAGEDQPQAVVGDRGRVVVRLRGGLGQLGRVRVRLGLEQAPPPQAVDGLVAGRLDDPGARVLGDAGARPLGHGGGKGFLGGLFRNVEVAEQTDEGRHHAAPVSAIDGIHRRVGVEGVRHE
jgi:hypothetical protein